MFNLSNTYKLKTLNLLLLIGIIYLFPNSSRAQTKIDVIETTFKVGAIEETFQYYGFAEGDQVIINLEEVNGKELKEFEILQMPNISKFMDYKTKKISDKIINITHTGVYKFRFYNSAIAGRIYKFKIQRIPVSENLKNFNTNVYWKTLIDTTYIPMQETYLVKSDTIATEVYNGDTQISSQNAINGNINRQLVNFELPKNTILWSFYVSTGETGKKAYHKMIADFSKTAASSAYKIPGYGPLASFALTGVPYFIKVQGEDNVKYYTMNDTPNAQLFIDGKAFRYTKGGDVINEVGRMPYPQTGRVYFGLINDNTLEPILVTLKVVAIVVNSQLGVREIKKMNINRRQEAYLKM